MTVGQLRQYLITNVDADLDNCEIVKEGSDHELVKTSLEIADAEKNGKHFFEYYGDKHMSSASKRVQVLLVV